MSNYQDKQKMTFWDFMTNYKIEIPIIQRDYAQGRKGKEYLRKSFLGDLKKALDSGEELKLDFVYGSKENGFLHPLDGQQRLTTLWLLHWYIALRARKLEEASETLKQFSYETRISSRDFCDNLCKPENFSDYYWGSIVAFITSRTWFYSAWKQDPTIQAMLRMLGGSQNDKKANNLDGIEQVFRCNCIRFNQCSYLYYWEKLTVNCPIGFYFLSLNEFKLTDDLYIKMNARGKQLTGFENFKADLIDYITKQTEETQQDEWKKLIDPMNGIPKKLDTDWTQIFWKYKSDGIKGGSGDVRQDAHIDEIYFAFINRFFWNELFIAKTKANDNDKDKYEYLLDLGDGSLENGTKTRTIENQNQSYRYLNREYHDEYVGFAPYLYYKDHKNAKDESMRIPISFFNDLTKVLDNHGEHLVIPPCEWDKSFEFIPKYDVDLKGSNLVNEQSGSKKTLKISTLSQIQRIVFFAVCKYLKKGKPEKVSLKRWMRVVWNLVSGEGSDGNYQIRNTEAMRKCMDFIGQLDSHNVYESLQAISSNQLPNSEFGRRCKEEIIKARWILYTENYITNKGRSWEDAIIEAENYAFFKGSIRFLYQDAEGKVNWDDFNAKWKNVNEFFDADGVKHHLRYNARLLRCFISKVQDIPREFWFGNGSHFWLSILLNNSYLRQVNDFLQNRSLRIVSNNGWVADDMLLGCIIEKDENWHILDSWRGYDVLTRYVNKQSGKVNSPRQIVVLGHHRNVVLPNVKDITIRNENKIEGCDNYFFGWDVDFKYSYNGKVYFFRWYGEPNDKKLDVYLMEENWNQYKQRTDITESNEKGTDEDNYYCFRYYFCQGMCVRNNTFTCFERNLQRLILEATK
jgi:hypothetical protein